MSTPITDAIISPLVQPLESVSYTHLVMHAKIVKYQAFWGGYYATSRTYQNTAEEIEGTDGGETVENYEEETQNGGQ